MKTFIVALITIACLGCSQSQMRIVVTEPEKPTPPPDFDSARWFSMPKDSSLYRIPSLPDGYSEAEAKQYLLGYKTGWEDEGNDIILGIIPGQTDVVSLFLPGKVVFQNETEPLKRGLADGRKQAERDFKLFRQQIEEQATAQNKVLENIGTNAPNSQH